MDLRAETLRLRDKAIELFRAHVAPRPMLAGGIAAAVVGLGAGFYLAPDAVWEQTPQRMATVAPVAPPAPVTPMVDETGRTPHYVIGADNLKTTPNPDEIVRVTGSWRPEPTELVEDEGRTRWWKPWTWRSDRGVSQDERDIDHREDRRRDAEQRRYDRQMARYEARQRDYDAQMAERDRYEDRRRSRDD